MAQCRFFFICGLDAHGEKDEGLCILHSRDRDKDSYRLHTELNERIRRGNLNFEGVVFPSLDGFARSFSQNIGGDISFQGAVFLKGCTFAGIAFKGEANFAQATFYEEANFVETKFERSANFSQATFIPTASFQNAVFSSKASFFGTKFESGTHFVGVAFKGDGVFANAKFTGAASFLLATFEGRADFSWAEWHGKVSYRDSSFSAGGDFQSTLFQCESVDFSLSHFLGRTIFSSREEANTITPIFKGAEVDFRWVTMDPPDAVAFRGADLSKCRLLGTDMRRVEVTEVDWPRVRKRFRVYDEIVPLKEGNARPLGEIERLYRELKQNCEDRRDYTRAGDFHYGEKEMRRRNPKTSYGLYALLSLYRVLSGYGESCLPPLAWFIAIMVLGGIGYLYFGLEAPKVGLLLVLNDWTGHPFSDLRLWNQAMIHSLQTMTLQKPEELIPIGVARWISTLQHLLGPFLLGLFGLAVRQQLKR